MTFASGGHSLSPMASGLNRQKSVCSIACAKTMGHKNSRYINIMTD